MKCCFVAAGSSTPALLRRDKVGESYLLSWLVTHSRKSNKAFSAPWNISSGTFFETRWKWMKCTFARSWLLFYHPWNLSCAHSFLRAQVPVAYIQDFQTNPVVVEWFCFLLNDLIDNRTPELLQALERFSQRFSLKADTNSWHFILPTAFRPAKRLTGAVKTQTHRIGCAIIMTSAF